MKNPWLLILLAVGAYFYFHKGNVDAFYYPDRHNLSNYKVFENVGSLEACRDAVMSAAMGQGDRVKGYNSAPISLAKGDYECGVNFKRWLGDMRVYEETVR